MNAETRNMITKPCTIVVHGALIGSIMQTPLPKDAMLPRNVIVRNSAFALLCILWSYAVGVPDMVKLLKHTTRNPSLYMAYRKNGKRGQIVNNIVQSFLPCQLRFTVLLFSDHLFFYCCLFCMAVAIAYYIYKLHHHEASDSNFTHPEYSMQAEPEYCEDTAHTPLHISHATEASASQGLGGMSIKVISLHMLHSPRWVS